MTTGAQHIHDTIRRMRTVDWGKTYGVSQVHVEDINRVCILAEMWIEYALTQKSGPENKDNE